MKDVNKLNQVDQRLLNQREILISEGINPYPYDVKRTHKISDIPDKRSSDVVIAGRIIANLGEHYLISDGTGKIKVNAILNLKANVGDIVEVKGSIKNEEYDSSKIRIITKAVVNLPSADEWDSFEYDLRKKHRDIGIIVDEELKKTFLDRSRINSIIRHFYTEEGFIEVETPCTVSFPEIAPVRPFTTQEPKFSQQVDLRITNTEYIRRLIVAGFDKVYQIGKCFRDEPVSFKHMPEFTQLTFGIAYSNYNALMENIERLTHTITQEMLGRSFVRHDGCDIDITPPWNRLTVRDALIKYTGIDIDHFSDPGDLRREIETRGFEIPEEYEYGGFLMMAALVDKLIEDQVIDNLFEPTFLCEYPHYLGGPAKEIENNQKYKQRSEVFIRGVELANISTPQNDPVKIQKWYAETLQLKQESGWVNQRLDEPYIHAINQGIPICTTGGLGLDRLIMFILEKDRIEDVVLFPWREYKEGGCRDE